MRSYGGGMARHTNLSLPFAKGGVSPKARRRDCKLSFYMINKSAVCRQSPTRCAGAPFAQGDFGNVYTVRDAPGVRIANSVQGSLMFILCGSSIPFTGDLCSMFFVGTCFRESLYTTTAVSLLIISVCAPAISCASCASRRQTGCSVKKCPAVITLIPASALSIQVL